jgi:predicted ribosome quality control (RQC) complex YloA/Tae2 family protein
MGTISDQDLRWFGARLAIAVYDTNREMKFMEEIKGLAATVKRAKNAIRSASDSSKRLEHSANALASNLGQVEGLTRELDGANAELQAAIGLLSNGGPPLDDTVSGAPSGTPDPRSGQTDPLAKDVPGSIRQVQILADRDR